MFLIQFMVVHIVDNSWCLYQIDIAEKTMFIMDPTMTMSEQGSMKIKHMRMAELILDSLFNRLREWYPNWHFSTFPWSYKCNYGMHPSCSKYSPLCNTPIISIYVLLILVT